MSTISYMIDARGDLAHIEALARRVSHGEWNDTLSAVPACLADAAAYEELAHAYWHAPVMADQVAPVPPQLWELDRHALEAGWEGDGSALGAMLQRRATGRA